MNRVRTLLFGLLALYFFNPHLAFSAYPGVCKLTVSYISANKLGTGNYYKAIFTVNTAAGTVTAANSPTMINGDYYLATCSLYYKDIKTGAWLHQTSATGFTSSGGPGVPGNIGTVDQLAEFLISAPCDSCDKTDSDGDGVCDSCDVSPGQPDKKHCVWNQSSTVSGKIGFMEIDQSGNCDGSQLTSFKDSTLDGQTQYFDIPTGGKEELSPPNCVADANTGTCGCKYAEGPSLLSPTTDSIDPATQGELEKLEDLQQNSNCTTLKERCESACLKYGGTFTNSCTSSVLNNYAECKCKDQTTINTKTDNSDSTTPSPGGDSSSTGGSDSNSDGKDDIYAAVKDAISDSGIGSKINQTNSLLNGIGNILNGISNSLKQGNEQGGEQGDGENQDINTSGSASLPNGNEYDTNITNPDEESFGQAVINFMSSGLPLVDFIRGTGINNGSGESSLTLSIFGSELDLDFLPYSDLLEWVGLILVFIASIIAFRIITNS